MRHVPRNLVGLALALNLLAASAFSQSAAPGYDELHDKNGNLRPQYQEFWDLWSHLSPEQREQYLVTSRQAFQGDNALNSLPRVMTANEYDKTLKPGVEQRAKALRAFLKDHYSGKKSYAKAGIVPSDVLRRIMGRSYELGYEGSVKPEHIWFLYGPDIIRDEKGNFRVIEDNPGFIGGVGDLRLAYRETMKLYSKNPDQAPFRSPEDFYRTLADKYKAEAHKRGGKAVVYMTSPYSDKEDLRIQEIFHDYGIETVTDRTNHRFEITSDGVFVQDIKRPAAPLEKVGFVAMIGEHWWLDPSHPQSKLKQAVEEIEAHLEEGGLEPLIEKQMRDLLNRIQENPESVRPSEINNLLNRSTYRNELKTALEKAPDAHGLISAILANKVGSNYAPGIDFIGDKEFYVFVEDMIRFYLHEEPILRNIPTERFADPRAGGVNEVLLQRVFGQLSKYVIKKVDGRGGDSVWVGPKIQSAEIQMLKEKIRANPGMYIVQEFTPLSHMGDIIVDMRVITDVSPDNVLVTETPWGRGLPMNGNGKVNLSDKGREVTILVQGKSVPSCRNLFKSFSRSL